MKLSVTTFKDDLFTLEVSDDIEIENLKVYCEMESGIPSANITLVWNGTPLTDNKKTVGQYGISDGEMLFLQPLHNRSDPRTGLSAAPTIDFSGIAPPTGAPQQRPSRSSTDRMHSENFC
ncbi:DDI2 [Bugula neritina]|uniref:DDI2 n=1 Tax=Bugula neritina TaxID=10212 RepID=A0A7J7KI70_BUGNE|nr:DDI2 [Bugula neritina]